MQSDDYRGFRYCPLKAFQRITSTSKNICTLSRIMLTFEAGECAHLTGTSAIDKP